ncbi:myo-inositol-1(or 4)-monophosphatase [Rubritalea squalenifaciens DSM 18772]|uniref:Myo-inositol-1(Or 4)-monophosphatase n=2 Tax=Rubritalea squalenifaciens TaxID=407226 RepID=A0A1M6AUF6_9BACT|nr:myo-inositol-1(or 4)-monophosphatase [Rubritalea squalenifaciens DSM 18772]
MPMQAILEKALEAVQAVADFQLKHFRAMPVGADNIKSLRETVSFVDVESEKILQDALLPLIEEAGFYGEESGKTGSQDLVWIVDPLDGTTNFLSGNDHFSISVALVKNGKPILGILCKPFSNETWTCIKGEGVFYKGEKTSKVSENLTEKDALFVTGFPYRSSDVAPSFFACAAEVLTLGRGIRRTGSAALDVTNLSCGWMQGFWETDLQPYDIAAAMLFAEENGCIVTNHQGGEYDIFSDRLMVAALPAVHAALLETIQKHYAADI